ncbi:MAG: MmcQ/YjbR family DNA-binding protein [Muribaculaceae bacterium]|nr:MmcQ/YjbR family DNA-binding protein [Muribaculaceae bacterium]
MDIESVREFALGLHGQVTEDLFAEQWVSWRIADKWFMLMQLDAPEPRVAVKLPPDVAIDLRERYGGVRPAYHMNKRHWSDLYLNELDDAFVKEQITASFRLVASRLPRRTRTLLLLTT